MGLRFRKSIKLGKHAKLNLNKKSIGVSFGGKHGRVSINSKGRKTTSFGIPGTGLSYVSSSKIGKSKRKSGNYSKNNSGKTFLHSNEDHQYSNDYDTYIENTDNSSKSGCLYLFILICFGISIILGAFLFYMLFTKQFHAMPKALGIMAVPLIVTLISLFKLVKEINSKDKTDDSKSDDFADNPVEKQDSSKDKNYGCFTVSIVVMIIIMLILGLLMTSCRSPKVDVENANAIEMTADDFASMFIEDADSAEKENKNKVFEITGTVDDIYKYSYEIELETSQNYSPYSTYSIKFDFAKKDYNQIPEEVKEDYIITIKAVFEEVSTDTLKFDDAIYISLSEPTEPTTESSTNSKANTELKTEKPTEKPTERPTEPPIEEAVEVEEENYYEEPVIEEDNNEADYEETPQENIQNDYQEEENNEYQFTVYYTETGSKYHYENPCGRGTYYECKLDEALAMGLEPCDKCVN